MLVGKCPKPSYERSAWIKLNIQWIKVLYGIALILIGIILAARHFIVAGNGIGYFISGIC
ncbi:hypothetical protein DW273_11895 [Ruminococcus sp. AM23-1]|uniref:Uncharacterized protein n=1 Tax=Dorea formicigenerans TaxID=39486 RepID=A0A413YI01_9FIRM|nr:hypothetical protein DXC28_01085 [Ruminococcus sp. OM08-9BH]RHC04671.1 hypothetical protein DW860_12315 [Dorea formicigenerans]RHC19524.1 hypothetical protein DW854_11580 [Dorea formicigenerans]RHN90792.1 hypothetical protein DW273_11895 [Ruminococcus sp. AM23-1]RHO86908.1 hypothetical protein DW049_09540 [Ruminococcus sp. AF41-9]